MSEKEKSFVSFWTGNGITVWDQDELRVRQIRKEKWNVPKPMPPVKPRIPASWSSKIKD